MSVLEAKNLVKIYNQFQANEFKALDGINLSVEEGDFLCIMGPSGSGKTTLINNLSTLDRPSNGKVIAFNENLRLLSGKELADFRYNYLGFVSQHLNLIDNLNNRDNITIAVKLNNKRQDEIDSRLEVLAKQLKIESILDKYPNECSTGQRQRVAICRALINEPELIVCDEPTGNLDTENSYELLQFLKKLNEERKTTIIMVTHDVVVASYAKRVIFLRNGVIEKSLQRNDSTQKQFYRQITDANSNEYLKLITD